MPPDYDTDYYAWLMTNAALLHHGRVTDMDAPHITEELEDMEN